MIVHNPNEAPEVVAKIEELWAELSSLSSSLDSCNYVSDPLPSGYYLYSARAISSNDYVAAQVLYNKTGATVIDTLSEYVKFVRKNIAEGGKLCQAMLAIEVAKAEDGDEAAKQRVETIYMPALGIKTYDEAEQTAMMAALASTLADKLKSAIGRSIGSNGIFG